MKTIPSNKIITSKYYENSGFIIDPRFSKYSFEIKNKQQQIFIPLSDTEFLSKQLSNYKINFIIDPFMEGIFIPFKNVEFI